MTVAKSGRAAGSGVAKPPTWAPSGAGAERASKPLLSGMRTASASAQESPPRPSKVMVIVEWFPAPVSSDIIPNVDAPDPPEAQVVLAPELPTHVFTGARPSSDSA